MNNRFSRTQQAIQTPFEALRNPDQSGNPGIITSTDVQNAIEELSRLVQVSASPGFTWGRSGSVVANAYLLNDSVPSNTSGRVIFLSSAVIQKIFVANQNATAGIVFNIYTHDGNGINLTLLGSVTTTAARTHTFTVSYSVALNKQVAVRVASGSVTATNPVVGCLIRGSIV